MDATRLASRRAALTGRLIDTAPLVFTQWRAGVQINPALTARILQPSGGAERRGDQTESTEGEVKVVTAAGTDLKHDDRLQGIGSVVYRLTFVAPNQIGRVEATAEVATR